jgi:hypothetical protein
MDESVMTEDKVKQLARAAFLHGHSVPPMKDWSKADQAKQLRAEFEHWWANDKLDTCYHPDLRTDEERR